MVLESTMVGKSRRWKRNMNIWDYLGVDHHLRFELALWLSMSLLTYATLWNCYGMHFRQGNIHRYAFITVIWLSRHFVYRWVCTSNRAGYYIRLLSAGHYFDVVSQQQPPPYKQPLSNKKKTTSSTGTTTKTINMILQWIQPYKIVLPIQWCIFVCTSTCIIWGYYVYLLQPDKKNNDTLDYPVGFFFLEADETGGGEPSMLEILFRLSWWSVAMSILLYGRLLYPMMDLKLSPTTIPSYYYSEEGTGGISSTVASWNPSSTTLFFLYFIFGRSYVQHNVYTHPSQQQQLQHQQSVPWSEHYHSMQKTRIPIWKYHWHISLLRILDYMFTVAFMPTTHFACKATHHCNANSHNIYNRQDGDGDETYHLITGVVPGWILLYMIFTFATSMLLAQTWTLHRSNLGWSLLQQQPKSRQTYCRQTHSNHLNTNTTNNKDKKYNHYPNNHHSSKQRRNRHHHSTTTNNNNNNDHTDQRHRPSKVLLLFLQNLWTGEMIGASSSSQLMNQLNNIHVCHALGLISLIAVFYFVNYFVFDDLPSPQVMPILLTSLLANYICCCALDTHHSSQIDEVSQEILSYTNYRKEKN